MKQPYSFKDGGKLLQEMGLDKEILSILEKCNTINDKETRNSAIGFGWKTKYRFLSEYDWEYDAFKDGVALEFERGEQVKARWSLIKFQLGKNREEVKVGVLILPKRERKGQQATLERVKSELESGIFDGTLNLDVPIYVIEFPEKKLPIS